MGLPGSDWGEIPYFSSPLCAPLQFSKIAFYFAPDKRPENIPDLEEVISYKQRLYIHTEGAFRLAKVKRETLITQIASFRLVEDSPMLGTSKLMVHLLRLSETSMKIISDF